MNMADGILPTGTCITKSMNTSCSTREVNSILVQLFGIVQLMRVGGVSCNYNAIINCEYKRTSTIYLFVISIDYFIPTYVINQY